MRQTTPELETTLMAYKYCFSMHLKFLKMAKNYMKGTRPHEEYMNKAKSYSEKCKELDYMIFIESNPAESGLIVLTEQTIDRWRKFAESETDYRDKVMNIQMKQGNFLLSSVSKKLNGLVHNSIFRQSTIIGAINKQNERRL